MVAEGEELQTNLLQASQRGPASSSVLDEVFGTHRAKADPALGGQAIAEVGLAKNRFHFRAGAKCVPPNSAAKAAAVVGLVKYQRR
jgi:hypothetical protein